MFTFWLLLLSAGATARITRIITSDTITNTFRKTVFNSTGIRLFDEEEPDEWRWMLLSCPWCIGFWISAGITWLGYWVLESAGYDLLDPALFVVPAIALTTSYIVGFIAGHEK